MTNHDRVPPRRAGWFLLWSLAIAAGVITPSAVEAAGTAKPVAIDYHVVRKPLDSAGVASFEITLRFVGDRSGRSTILVPSEWASAQHAELGIDELTVTTPGARLVKIGTGQQIDAENRMIPWRVEHRPAATLEVRYRLRQIAQSEPSGSASTNYLPVIRPDYFEWIGWTSWVIPFADDRPVRVHVHFEGLPDDWNFASTFGLERANVSFEGPISTFRQSIFIGGDFRLRSRPVRGGQVVVAVRGEWPFRDGELADRLQTIVDGERAFWSDTGRNDFLVTMMPLAADPGVRSINGTGLGQSFATFLTRVRTLDELDGLFAHEYFHTWNAIGLGTFRDPEALGYWFSEGFTDYYSALLRLRWGMSTLAGYAAAYDDIYRALASLPEAELSNAEIGPRFFSEGRTVGKLPYLRGMLLAAKWDSEIRASSNGKHSLDDAMLRLRHAFLRGARHLDAARVVEAVGSLGAPDPQHDVERFIDAGQRLVLADGTLGTCIRIDAITERTFDAGFDTDTTLRTRTMTGVDPRGAAYAAGLRDGQPVRGWSIHFGQADVPVRVVVSSDDLSASRTIAYLPVGRAIERPHVALAAALAPADETRCLAGFESVRPPPARTPRS